jgi:hypothetical protein
MSAIHIGESAKKSDAMPLGRYCSVQAKMPLLATSSAIPVIAAPRHSLARGSGVPRARHHTQRIVPEHTNRSATIENGGIVATARRIAGAVEPHNT